jgi:hypothetical protein
MALHGKVKQMKRIQASRHRAHASNYCNTCQLFYDFCKRDAAVLFATDVAARSTRPLLSPCEHDSTLIRGLDFPSVDWVVQFDCPDSTATYIHRAGRAYPTRAKTLSSGNASWHPPVLLPVALIDLFG